MSCQDIDDDFKVAVVGMACVLPKAPNLRSYWKALLQGNELLTHFSKPEAAEIIGKKEEQIPDDLVISYGFIENADHFDHQFFGFTRNEALRLDPQHRVFLQTCWQALEDASCDPLSYGGKIGVFAGSGPSDYYSYLKSNADKLAGASDWELKIDTAADFLVSRVAYKLGLRGPAVAVQSACSTSLVAIHMGIQSLLAGESDMVLAGGVTLSIIPKFDPYDPGGITAKDGHCRPFDAKASGTIGSSGCGVVVLKLLKDALRDGDFIYGTVLGSSINNDGNAKMSFSSPSLIGQQDAIERAIQAANIEADTVGFIETHGTGTQLGDPIEVTSLSRAYRFTPGSTCYLGSVKSNLGHTDTAAGVCGFIKAMLTIHHGLIPPTVHFEFPNPNLEIEETAFSINREVVRWSSKSNGPRRAGVNSLGVGGTNAHVILEEFNSETQRDVPREQKTFFFPVSAGGPQELTRSLEELRDFCAEHPEKLGDVAATLQRGRRHFDYRAFLMASNSKELSREIERVNLGPERTVKATKDPKVCLMFPGQGGQYEGMGKSLLSEGGIYSEVARRCIKAFENMGIGLEQVLWPKNEGGSHSLGEDDKIHRMTYAQAAIFTLEVSLAFRFKEILKGNIHALLGHSLGSYAAACLAGVFSLEDACRIVRERGAIFEKLASGSMLAVLASEKDIQPLLSQELSIAAINHPSQVILSGPTSAIKQFLPKLGRVGFDSRLLHVSCAAHSSMLDPHLKDFERFLQSVSFHSPKIPLLSDSTGDWAKPEEISTPQYWVSHLRGVVRFSDCVDRLSLEREFRIFELGPGHTLSSLIIGHPNYQNQPLYSTVPHVSEEHEARYDLKALALAWESGVDLDWSKISPVSPGRRIPIPGYSFAKNRFNILNPNPIQIEGEALQLKQNKSTGDRSCPYRSEILAIFQEIFGDPSIGGEDNFFDLGGSSLLALSLFRSIRAKLAVETPSKLIFKYQTPNSLADEIKRLSIQETLNV
jgi:phthiocerol/phenolphthiocerol synthesis type-I polyketide synthase E